MHIIAVALSFTITLYVFVEILVYPYLNKHAPGNPFNGLLATVVSLSPASLVALVVYLIITKL